MNLIRQNTPWVWGPTEDSAFNCMKELLTSSPCLVLIDFTEVIVPLELCTDASKYTLGGALVTCMDRYLCSVAYYSRKLSPKEYNHSIRDGELLMVVDCLRYFQHCLCKYCCSKGGKLQLQLTQFIDLFWQTIFYQQKFAKTQVILLFSPKTSALWPCSYSRLVLQCCCDIMHMFRVLMTWWKPPKQQPLHSLPL